MAEGYRHRLVDDVLDQWLAHLPAVSIEGPKGVGKTATAQRRARTARYLDLAEAAALIRADPGRVVLGDPPVLVDEWQRIPEVWDRVRRAVDAGAPGGSFLLTGSASAQGPTHSGAGRIQRIRMWPLTLPERGVTDPTVSLKALLSGEQGEISGETGFALPEYVQAITRSGLPALQDLPLEVAELRVEDYVDRIAEVEVVDSGVRAARPALLRRWLRAYAGAVATTTTYDKLRDAASPGEAEKLSKGTDVAYRDALERLWIVEPVPAWVPNVAYLARLTKAPKHGLADPAFAAAALGLNAERLLAGAEPSSGRPTSGHVTFTGALFESLVTQHVRAFAARHRAQVYHARTQGGREEIDLIIERRDARVVALEVKLAANPPERAFTHLAKLKARMGDGLLDAAVITTGRHAYRRPDGIAVIPFALLGA